VASALVWWAIPAETDRRLLRPRPGRRLSRSARSLAIRFAAAVMAWPHVVELVLRTKHTRVATASKKRIWRDGHTVLWRYRRETPARHPEPVLLVHSLVTQPWILDLTPTRSLVRALLADGFDVYLLDWGEVGWRQAQRGLDDYGEALLTAEEKVLQTSEAIRLHLVGYCLGATLALLRLVAEPALEVASFTAIAPPVDLSVRGGFRSTLGSRRLRPSLALDGAGCVPAPLVREAFHVLRPMALRTEWRRWRSRKEGEEAEYHAAMARWTWEHRRLPGALFFDLVDLYRTNGLVDLLPHLTLPVFLAVAEHDHIVPWASSAVLRTLPNATVDTLVCPSGHVSMLVGEDGRDRLWPALCEWLATAGARKGGRRPRQPAHPVPR
jgi:poly[(R)-3-hydroxyalkanoate] polymerase subunit PhaC